MSDEYFPALDWRRNNANLRAEYESRVRSCAERRSVVPAEQPGLRTAAIRETQQVRSPSSPTPPPKTTLEEVSWRVIPPYASLLRELVEQDRIRQARLLLDFALREQPGIPAFQMWRRLLQEPRTCAVPVSEPERTLERSWLASHSATRRGHWVALLGGRELCSDRTLKGLRIKLCNLQVPGRPLVHRISESDDAASRF